MMQCAPESAWIRLREQCPGVASPELMNVIALFPAEKVQDSSYHSCLQIYYILEGEKLDINITIKLMYHLSA